MATPNTHYSAEQLDAMLADVNALYFLGIGGISMSSLALLSADGGRRIGGYDRVQTPLTRSLTAQGISVDTQASAHNLDTFDAVVYTVAMSADAPEYREAMRRGIPLVSRSNYMGYWMLRYPERIGVAGTHGKSTTTGMLHAVWMAAEADPAVLCGALLTDEGRAYRRGAGNTVIFEACEYMDSFLDFYPSTAILLNVELDHVDYFPDLDRMCASYAAFAARTGERGCVIYNADDPNACSAALRSAGKRISFGFSEGADYRAGELLRQDGKQSFCVTAYGKPLGRITLSVAGRHNVSNALAAVAAAAQGGIAWQAIVRGLSQFRGVHRRMEYKGRLRGAALYDDYAHHPTEICASVAAARELGDGRLVCVFQSHTYSRTAALFDAFVAALAAADCVILAPIYAAREQNHSGVTEQTLAEALRARGCDAIAADSPSAVVDCLRTTVRPTDTVLVMGAGDVEKIYPLLATELQE